MSGGWIGVDLDGTLAYYDRWREEIGPPIPAMLKRVIDWVAQGKDVRIFTARVFGDDDGSVRERIEDWCLKYIGVALPITNIKDPGMVQLWDDRAVGIIPNKGYPDIPEWAR